MVISQPSPQKSIRGTILLGGYVIVPPCGLSLQEPLSSNNPREHSDSLFSLKALVILEPTMIYSLSSARSLRAPHDMGAPYAYRALLSSTASTVRGNSKDARAETLIKSHVFFIRT